MAFSASLAELDRLIADLGQPRQNQTQGRQQQPPQATNVGPADFAWNPHLPVGHTSFSWSGVEGGPPKLQEPENVADAATSTTAAEKPAKPRGKKEKDGDAANKQESQQKKAKQPKAPKQPKQKAGAAEEESKVSHPFYRMDIRVGRIVHVEKHPDADSLYVEKIDVGEAEPRQIVSGLVNHVPIEEMRDALVLVVANLKPAPLRSVQSFGMVLAAANADRSTIELVKPPPGSAVGERVVLVDVPPSDSDAEVNTKKKNNAFGVLAPMLRTTETLQASCDGHIMITSQGPCSVSKVAGGTIS